METNIEVSALVSDLGVAASIFWNIYFLGGGDSRDQDSGSEARDWSKICRSLTIFTSVPSSVNSVHHRFDKNYVNLTPSIHYVCF